MRILNRGKVLLVGACIMAGAAGWAQQIQKPVAPDTVSTDLAVTFAVERSQVAPGLSSFWFKGGGADAAVTFRSGFGIAASLTGDHASNVTSGVDVNKFSYYAGPRYTWTAWQGHAGAADNRRLQVYGQALFGWTHGFNGLYPAMPAATSSAQSFAFQDGGGFNYYLTRNLGIRLLEANFVRTSLPNNASNIQNDLRLSAGITWHIASATPPPVTLSCSANPSTVFPGDPVTVTATPGGLNPRLHAVYSFSGSGVSGNGTTATVATAALAPGSYTVNCGVKEGKPGKEGLKPWETADATTSFTVKAFEPPTINCSANPSTIKAGESSTIAASGVSPQNRPLTYSYSATAGTVAGNGASATFSSIGAPTGATTVVTCNVNDDKGQTATANANVAILAPYVAPAPVEPPAVKQLEARLALHSVFFPTNLPTTKNPKVGLLASQAGTLTTLASDFNKYLEFKPDAHLILSGHADVRGSAKFNQALSERRVARTKSFLVEKSVPEAKIETHGFGSQSNLTAAQVKAMVAENPDLSAAERGRILHDLGVIVWAQNRRVDITLSTTGEQSVQHFPFNAADSLTLIGKKTAAPVKKTVAPVKKATGGAAKKPVRPVK